MVTGISVVAKEPITVRFREIKEMDNTDKMVMIGVKYGIRKSITSLLLHSTCQETYQNLFAWKMYGVQTVSVCAN